jgi:ABC-type bacteriocin/lantibiotic exporter with double-glycine peptidase domain
MEENIGRQPPSMFRETFFALLSVVILVLPGCAQKEITSESQSQSVILENVPFVKQKDKYCGPSAMASVLQFYGMDINQDEIAEDIYIPELNGALISDMENYASAKGYRVHTSNGDIEELKTNIDNGIPVILLVDKGKWKISVPHYYVAYGYNDEKDTIILHAGDKKHQEISYAKLNQEWERMNNLMLVVAP